MCNSANLQDLYKPSQQRKSEKYFDVIHAVSNVQSHFEKISAYKMDLSECIDKWKSHVIEYLCLDYCSVCSYQD